MTSTPSPTTNPSPPPSLDTSPSPGQTKKITISGKTYNFPSTFTPDQVQSFLTRKGIIRPPSPMPGSAPSKPSGPPPEGFGHRMVRETVSNLPAIGATAGGALGGAVATPADVATGPLGTTAGALGGATIGGGVGEVARQLIGHWFPTLATAPSTNQEAMEQTVQQMALGGATELLGPVQNKLMGWLAGPVRASAARGLKAVMNPLGGEAELRAGKAATGLLEKGGYWAATRGQLEKRAAGKIADLGEKINQAEAGLTQEQHQAQPILDKLTKYEETLNLPPVAGGMSPEDTKLLSDIGKGQGVRDFAKATPEQQKSIRTLAERVKGKPLSNSELVSQPNYNSEDRIAAVKRVRQILSTQAPEGTISRESLRKIRQALDKSIDAAGGFTRGVLPTPKMADVAEAEKNMAGAIRDVLHTDHPDITKLDAEFSLWKNVKSAMTSRSVKEDIPKTDSPWRAMWHARSAAYIATTGAGGALGGALGGATGAEEASVATGGLLAVHALVTSTAWRTVSAATKNELADLLAKGEFEKTAKLCTRIVVMHQGLKKATPSGGAVPKQ